MRCCSAASQSSYDSTTGQSIWSDEYRWDTSALTSGTYQIRVTPKDGRGNVGASVESIEFDLATLTVTNTNDSGSGSLREAMLIANASPGLDTVAFNIDGPCPHLIQPLTDLPFITDAMIIVY